VHHLRHTCATLLLSRGVHPKIVQELLGHSQISLTLDTYSHVLPSMQEEAAREMESVLGAKPAQCESRGRLRQTVGAALVAAPPIPARLFWPRIVLRCPAWPIPLRSSTIVLDAGRRRHWRGSGCRQEAGSLLRGPAGFPLTSPDTDRQATHDDQL